MTKETFINYKNRYTTSRQKHPKIPNAFEKLEIQDEVIKFLKENNVDTTTLIDQFPSLKAAVLNNQITTSTIRQLRRKLKVPFKGKEKKKYVKDIYLKLSEPNELFVSNFLDEVSFSPQSRKYLKNSLIKRLITRARKTNPELSDAQILQELNKVDKKKLTEVLKLNSELRNKVNFAKYKLGETIDEYGIRTKKKFIEGDYYNVSHMEDVLRNWKNTLKENNLFFAEAKLNFPFQYNIDNKIEKLLEKLKTVKNKSEEKLLSSEIKKLEKELKENNLISVIDETPYGGKSITAESSAERINKKIEEEIKKRIHEVTNLNQGGMVGFNHLVRPLGNF